MTAAQKLDLISVEEYLAGELVSPIKHEYLGGFVYAMAGARNVHNLIASNTLGALHGRLRGKAAAGPSIRTPRFASACRTRCVFIIPRYR